VDPAGEEASTPVRKPKILEKVAEEEDGSGGWF
jgi:hypothetical protein